LRAATRGGVAPTFGEEVDLGNAGRAAMAEKLNDSGDGVGSVESAFSAMDDFDFIHVVDRLIGEIEEAARLVDRCAVDEELGEIGVAAIEEKRGETAFAAGAGDGRAGKNLQRVGERDQLPPTNVVPCDGLHGGGGLAKLEWLGVGGDDDVL